MAQLAWRRNFNRCEGQKYVLPQWSMVLLRGEFSLKIFEKIRFLWCYLQEASCGREQPQAKSKT